MNDEIQEHNDLYKSIDICIPTYKRPLELRRLLKSIIHMQSSSFYVSNVIVVDNDISGSAKKIVSDFCELLSISYFIETRRGVVHVRNTALKNTRSPFVALVDDDEYVDKNWLVKLIEYQRKTMADVVFGEVNSIQCESTPKWILRMSEVDNVIQSDTPKSGGTNNALIRMEKFRLGKYEFDEKFALSGGEDTDLFYRLYRDGFVLKFCSEAIVYEPIPASRNNFKWHWIRNFRVGQTNARVFGVHNIRAMEFLRVLQKLIIVFISLIIAPFFLVIGTHKLARLILLIARSLGYISAYFGVSVREYG